MSAHEEVAEEAVEVIRRARDDLASQAEVVEELPNVIPVLDLESRAGDERRIYMHIVQMCTQHMAHFVASNRIKHIYLMDGFLAAREHGNAPVLYATARAMFEHNAFLHQVQKRLKDTFDHVDERNWRSSGEKFFGLAIRARFATSDSEKRAALKSVGLSDSRLKPFNITDCVRSLKAVEGYEDAEARYASLCDFVHHNLGSVAATISGSRATDYVEYEGGGMFTRTPGDWLQYQYPVATAARPDWMSLAPHFVRDMDACRTWINDMPHMPFSEDMNVRHTGYELAAMVIHPGGD